MPRPSDIPGSKLRAVHTAMRGEERLTELAEQANFAVKLFLDKGYSLDAALDLTDITLDRYDNLKETK
nr:hypothetical protein [Corynebacterium sp. UBA5992]